MSGDKHHIEEALPRFSLNRRIGVLVLLASMVVVGVVAALGILATFSFIFSFPDYVTKPVEELTAGIRRLAAGDYSQRLPTPVYSEFTELLKASGVVNESL